MVPALSRGGRRSSASHDSVKRGASVYCEVPLTFAQAALGDEIEIPTLTERVKLKIPAGTQTEPSSA